MIQAYDALVRLRHGADCDSAGPSLTKTCKMGKLGVGSSAAANGMKRGVRGGNETGRGEKKNDEAQEGGERRVEWFAVSGVTTKC